ncbi:MAG: Thiol oxidoreductase-like protein [Candidatus Solibacter sp.]|nr:Thiol oxidoreductase-like protein [Candidatus Solibacter sp.]
MHRTCLCVFLLVSSTSAFAQHDPGPDRGSPRAGTNGSPSTGDPLSNLTSGESTAFSSGKLTFQEVDSVTGKLSAGSGLGPRFNMDSCSGCHAFPAIGGSSPPANPQIAVATRAGARNTVPSFLSLSGPVREVRFVKTPTGAADGGVHDLFTITGRSDAVGCNVAQPNFAAEVAANNAVFRIPTPLFGSGLIEAIDDATIMDNKAANATQKAALGIAGHENRNGNDGSLTRFGWKAQNKSLFIFAGEAYNVEQGVTNDVFPNERDSTAGCLFNPTPEDHIDVNGGTRFRPTTTPSDIIDFVFFMRFLAPPARGPSTSSSGNGEDLFTSTGCALCHTPSLKTSGSVTAALSNKDANLFSDLLVHNMGSGLADGISQGFAAGNEFRTAPLWGLGQRLFFLHDGRTSDLTVVVAAHASPGSEANGVIAKFNALTAQQKQDLLQFLRSL